ncbi:MAG: DUF302 domain-containing protein [Geminicoccaceae bacterium]
MALHNLIRAAVATAALLLYAAVAQAGSTLSERPGWVIMPSAHDYATLVERTNKAVEDSPINIVTRASATVGAKSLGKTIPGNMVIGVYGPQFAVRMLDASVQAGIEAPLRLYLTENDDGTASLSYRTATHVFEPYFDDGGEALQSLASDLDGVLESIANQAVGDG